MLKHTPGSWEWYPETEWRRGNCLDFDELRAGNKSVLSGNWHNDNTAGIFVENAADAKLIVAAPDLLASLEDLIGVAHSAMDLANRVGAEFNINEELREARAAIAKATA